MTAARKLATYDDLLALPEDVRAEVLRGVLEVSPAPRPRHSKVQGAQLEVARLFPPPPPSTSSE